MPKSEVPAGKAVPRQAVVLVAPVQAPPVVPRALQELPAVRELREQAVRQVAPARVAAPESG